MNRYTFSSYLKIETNIPEKPIFNEPGIEQLRIIKNTIGVVCSFQLN